MTLILAYIAGLLTLINPCVLPVLPIVLASSLNRHRLAPVALTAGMAATFVGFGLLIAVAGRSLGLDNDMLSSISAVVMILFGLALLVPQAGAVFQTAVAGVAARADAGIDSAQAQGGLAGQALGGALLGAAWSPCIGPTLGGAIALASSGGSLILAGATMLAFAAGVATLMLALAYGARDLLMRNRARAQALAVRARPVLGGVFVAVGLLILSGGLRMIEALAVQYLPFWLQDLSVSL